MKRITKTEKRIIIDEDELSSKTIAAIIGCSVGTVNYYRRRGIWKHK
jgi:DNA-binding CsgD family transcriptional regulator